LDCAVKACSYESQHKLDLSSIVLAVPGPVIPSLYTGMAKKWFFFLCGGGGGGGGVFLYLFNLFPTFRH